MSLNIIGKVMGSDAARLASALSSIAAANAVAVALDQLDIEDRVALEESGYLKGPGVFFAFSTENDAGDAAQLWIDAMTRVRQHVGTGACEPDQLPGRVMDEFSATRLGRVCSEVLSCGMAAGIALVDGGIDQVFVASREACLRRVACDVVRAWDQSPNRLYVAAATDLWDDEVVRYLAMAESERRQWLARLLFALTVFARGTYTVGENGLDDPGRMRRFNELMHRTASQLRDHLESSPGRPDEVFLRIVGEEIAVLNVAVAGIVHTLRQ